MTLEKTIAEAICDAFWRTAEIPRTYKSSPPIQRQVWDLCAVAAVDAARAFRDRQKARAA